MKNGKRIESVTIKTFADVDPDTSYLGKYSNRPDGEYSIDREHATDCASQPYNVHPASDTLQHVLNHLFTHRASIGNDSDNPYYWGIEDAIDKVADIQKSMSDCDCSGGDKSRNEYQFFTPVSENYKGDTHENIVKYCLRDYERMESLNSGNWQHIGIRADAKIIVDSHIQHITSGGLWGIESDIGRDYLESVERDELADLKSQLRALGFGTRAVSSAFKSVSHEYE